MSEAVNNAAMVQQLKGIADDVRDVRKSMSDYARSNLENAVKLERVLTQMEQLSRVSQEFELLRTQVGENQIRIQMAEEVLRSMPDHDARLKKLESLYMRFFIAGLMLIGGAEIAAHFVNWFMSKAHT